MYHAEVQHDKALEMKNASRCILQFKILFSIPHSRRGEARIEQKEQKERRREG